MQGTDKLPEYVPFTNVPNKSQLLLQFAEDLCVAGRSSAGLQMMHRALQATFGTTKCNKEDKIVLKYDVAYSDKLQLYALTFNGRRDSDMIRLGHKYKFPRGCPVLWKPGEFIDVRGFYPKFENDDISESTFDASVLQGSTAVDFFLKWSGFLIQLVAFEMKGAYFWTVFSKQKLDHESPFVNLGRSLMEPHMTMGVVKRLADGHLYLGAEGLSPQDDTHGYIARRSAAVVTCIGQGTFCSLSSNESSVGFPDRLVMYFTNHEICQFCGEHGLICDTAITVHGDTPTLSDFFRHLLEARDFLRFPDFQSKLRDFQAAMPANLTILPSPAGLDHADLVGPTLEGLVLCIRKPAGADEVIKVKLPFYTWRTMFLRAWLDDLTGRKARGSQTADAPTLTVGDQTFVSGDALRRMQSFATRWCGSPEGQEHFLRLMKAAAVTLQSSGPDAIITDSLHVHLADEVEALSPSALNEKAAHFDEMMVAKVGAKVGAIPDSPAKQSDRDGGGVPIVCCVVVGPIGSGKSTCANILVAHSGDGAVHVDGDHVAPAGLTDCLHGERRDASLAAVYDGVLAGKHVVFSTGGGVLDGVDVKKEMRAIFGRPVTLVVLVMKDVHGNDAPDRYEVQRRRAEDLEPELQDIYRPCAKSMRRIIQSRVAREEWKRGALADVEGVCARSRKNADFAAQQIGRADIVFTVPYDTSPAHHDYPPQVLHSLVTGFDLVASMLRPTPGPDAPLPGGYFRQLRAVVSREDPKRGRTCKHVTLRYDARTFAATRADRTDLAGRFERECAVIKAEMFTLAGCTEDQLVRTEISVGVVAAGTLPVAVEDAHVTEQSGILKPAAMKLVVREIAAWRARGEPAGEALKLPCWLPKEKREVELVFALSPEVVRRRDVEYQFVDVLLL